MNRANYPIFSILYFSFSIILCFIFSIETIANLFNHFCPITITQRVKGFNFLFAENI